MVKRRVWAWGAGGWGSNSTACCEAGSKGLGHLDRDNDLVNKLGNMIMDMKNPIVFLSYVLSMKNTCTLSLSLLTQEVFGSIPVVKQQPNRFSRARVGHTEVHQQHQTGIRRVEQPHFQVEGFPQQHLQRLVILRIVAVVLCVCDERRWVAVIWVYFLTTFHPAHSWVGVRLQLTCWSIALQKIA